MPPAFIIFQESAKTRSSCNTAPPNSLWQEADKGPDLPGVALHAFSATIWKKHLHLAALISTRWDAQTSADGQENACFGTRCCVLPQRPNMTEGGHYKWSGGVLVQDYYNLLHLVDWNTAQRGLWSGLKRQMRNRSHVVWGRRGRNPVIAGHKVVSTEMIAFRLKHALLFITFSLTAQEIQIDWSDVKKQKTKSTSQNDHSQY